MSCIFQHGLASGEPAVVHQRRLQYPNETPLPPCQSAQTRSLVMARYAHPGLMLGSIFARRGLLLPQRELQVRHRHSPANELTAAFSIAAAVIRPPTAAETLGSAHNAPVPGFPPHAAG